MTQRAYADPDCPKCGGAGFIYAESLLHGGRSCDCTLDYLRRQNMDKIWRSLSQAPEVPELRERPPLLQLTDQNLWITAKEKTFRAHLKGIAYRRSHMWDARVWSDKDLLKAWLNTAYAQGHKIYDTELDHVTVSAMYIDELVEPYELVILMLGVKEAPNKEAPNVLLEAIKTRLHVGRPIWIVDQPQRRIDRIDHRFYSEQLEGILLHWPHLELAGGGVKLAGGSLRPAHPVSDTDPEEILDAGDPRAGAVIDVALSDIGDHEADQDDPPEDDEQDALEEEDDEPGTPTRSLLSGLAQNEERQEEHARRKRFKKPAPRKGGKK